MKRLLAGSTRMTLYLAILTAIALFITSGQEAAVAQTTARVWVAHYAPFADTLPGTAVTVRVNGTDVLTDFQFGETSAGYVTLPATSTLVEIVLPGGTVAISDTFTLAADTDYTVAAIGDGVNQPLELFALVDDNNAPDPGNGKVRIAHLAPFAGGGHATEVDIRTDAGDLILNNVLYKAFTDPYLTLPVGEYDLKITTANGSTDLLDIAPFTLTDGEILGVFAIGDNANQPLQVLALNQAKATTARVWVAHLAPFADTLPGTAVTVRVNGIDALTDFQFGETSEGYLDLPATATLVEIVLPGGTVAISDTFTLAADTDYTVAAIGDGVNQPLELFALVDDNNAPDPGNGKVRIAHLAPFANTLAATEVDIRTDAGDLILDNVPYKAFTDPYLTLPVGEYDLKITTPDGATDLLDLAPLTLTDGEILGVFAIGDNANQPLQVLALNQVKATTARVWVAHYAPFADTLPATAVTVRVNGIDALTDFQFGETSEGYLDLPATATLVEIVLPGGTVAISDTFTLAADTDYTVAAIGDGVNQPLELFALVDDNAAPDPGNGKVRIAHLAPFANTLAATEVDIRTDAGDLILNNVPYKAFTDPYLTLPVGEYDLKITTPDGATDLLDLEPFLLVDGQVLSVFAIGDLVNQPLQVGVLDQTEMGTARVWVAHMAPFADTLPGTSVTVRVHGVDALTDFQFGETSEGYLDLPATATLVEIVLPGGTVAISDTFTLAADTDYTVAAIGDGMNQPLELFALVDDNAAPPADSGKVRIAHLAPFADTLPATEVDIRFDDGTPVVTNVPYKGFTDPYLILPARGYDLKITTPGGGTDLLDLEPFLLAKGQILGVFAIGDLVNQPLEVQALVYEPGQLHYNYFPFVLNH